MENERNQQKTTRELAVEWWNPKAMDRIRLCEKYFPGRKSGTLTGREIEEIWKNEVQGKEIRDSYHNAEYLKLHQKQIAHEIIDLVGENQFKEIIKESEKRVNQKKIKEFNSELFKSYIDKFSKEDKFKALVTLANVLNFNVYTSDEGFSLKKQ